jgi:hypothetical protein
MPYPSHIDRISQPSLVTPTILGYASNRVLTLRTMDRPDGRLLPGSQAWEVMGKRARDGHGRADGPRRLLRDADARPVGGPSLCERWRVRDVVAHVMSFDGVNPFGIFAAPFGVDSYTSTRSAYPGPDD